MERDRYRAEAVVAMYSVANVQEVLIAIKEWLEALLALEGLIELR